MSRITILAITNGKSTGVAYYRIQLPLNYLVNNNSDEFDVLCLSAEEVDIDAEALNNVRICHFHANITQHTVITDKLLKMQKNGCKLVMDLDDYFVVPSSNPHAKDYNSKITKNILNIISKVDYLTTTTKLYSKELKKYNKNVFVLPNVIDNNIKQFNQDWLPSKRLRIGLVGGVSHVKDIEQLNGMVGQLKPYLDKIQFVICGFNTDGHRYPEFSKWNIFEKMLTDNYSILSDEYKDWLFTYSKDEYYDIDNQPYRRCWSKDVSSFGELYRNVDILLAPLENTKFNCMKSELKVVEAGNFRKLFIGSKVGQYKEIVTDGFDGLLIPPNSVDGWSRAIIKLLNNQLLYDLLIENCARLNNNKYSIERWNDKRMDFYKKLIK